MRDTPRKPCTILFKLGITYSAVAVSQTLHQFHLLAFVPSMWQRQHQVGGPRQHRNLLARHTCLDTHKCTQHNAKTYGVLTWNSEVHAREAGGESTEDSSPIQREQDRENKRPRCRLALTRRMCVLNPTLLHRCSSLTRGTVLGWLHGSILRKPVLSLDRHMHRFFQGRKTPWAYVVNLRPIA